MLRFASYALVALIPALSFAAPTKKNVDTSASKIEWRGTKTLVNSSHNGTVQLDKSSFLTLDGDKVTAGEIVVDMTSIKNVDLTDPEYNGKLVGHLKSEDFFAVDQFKTAKFVIKKVTPDAEGKQWFEGDLTIRGITQPAKVLADVKKEKNVYVATGKMDFDRTKFNIKYNSKDHFPNLVKTGKDKVIGNQVDLEFTVKTK